MQNPDLNLLRIFDLLFEERSVSRAARRLNLAQAFNPLGSITGIVIGSQFILSGVTRSPAEIAAMAPGALAQWRAGEAAAVQLPYLLIGLGVLAWAVLIRLTPFPAIATQRDVEEGVGALDDFRALLRTPRVLLGITAQFFYVGAQVGVWSFLIRYAEVAVPGTHERVAAGYLTISLVVFMAGRFFGSALMGMVRAPLLLAIFAIAGALLCIVATVAGGMTGIVALIASSFGLGTVIAPIAFQGHEGKEENLLLAVVKAIDDKKLDEARTKIAEIFKKMNDEGEK